MTKKRAEMLVTVSQALRTQRPLLNLSDRYDVMGNQTGASQTSAVASFKLFFTLDLIYQTTEFRNHEEGKKTYSTTN